MHHYRREQVGLVAPGVGGRVVHLRLHLQFSEYAFLVAEPAINVRHFFWPIPDCWSRSIPAFIGNEQIVLDHALVLFTVLSADKHEAVAFLPADHFPIRIEEAALAIETTSSKRCNPG